MSAHSPATTCKCGGRIEPNTNGNGTLVDQCVRCGARYDEHGLQILKAKTPLPAPSIQVHPVHPSLPGFKADRRCEVTGCPGLLDAHNRCACCEKRAAWAEEHMPKRLCEVCGGIINNRTTRAKYCAACSTVVQKSQVANAHMTTKPPTSAKAPT